MTSEETKYRIIKLIEARPEITQRQVAQDLGISLGKANYCLRARIDKGQVKARNFRQSKDKKPYIYYLTPKGIEEKALLTARFLKIKMQEYEDLKREIEQLKSEVSRQANKL